MFDTVKLYGGIAALLALLALVVFAGYQYDQRKLDDAKMDKLGVVIQAQTAALTQLQAGVDASNVAIVALAASQSQVAQHGGMVRARVTTLRNSNDAIRSYLDTALPPNGCLLDDSCSPASGAAEAVSSAASAVRSAGNDAVGH